MPWHDLSNISISDLIRYVQPSGDELYALPFIKIVENFQYLKSRLYFGNGAPNFTPMQSEAWYVQVDVRPARLWFFANTHWVEVNSNLVMLTGTSDPNFTPSEERPFFLNTTTKTLFFYDKSTSQWLKISGGVNLLFGDTDPSGNLNVEKALYLNRTYNTIWAWDTNQWRKITTLPYIDLTNATSDYFLQRQEIAVIRAENVTQKPLRIATQNETAYLMFIISLQPTATSGGGSNLVYLYPNNTTYSNAFRYVEVFGNTGGTPQGLTAIYSAFKIGWAYMTGFYWIHNVTINKRVGYIFFCTGFSYEPGYDLSITSWVDTTTSWTSLGTIVWPQTSSAVILVYRIW